MTTSRLYLLVVLSCLTALLCQPRGLAAQTALSPEIQRRIERVCACLTTTVVVKGAPKACQTLQDRMAAAHVPGVSIAVIHIRTTLRLSTSASTKNFPTRRSKLSPPFQNYDP
jgi:hypothetical protein